MAKYKIRKGRIYADAKDPGIAGSYVMASYLAEYLDSFFSGRFNGAVVDLGCGCAPLLEAYRSTADGVTLIDWEMSHHSVNDINIIKHNVNDGIPVQESSVDTLVVTDVVEHLVDPRFIFDEIARVLKDEGTAIVTLPFLYEIHEQPYDFVRLTEFGIKEMARRSGLEVRDLKRLGGSLSVCMNIFSTHLCAGTGLNALSLALEKIFWSLRRQWPFRFIEERTSEKYTLGYAFTLSRKR